MAAFATHTDLATRLGVDLTTAEETRADSLLDDASDLVREAARQEIELVTDDIFTTRGTDENWLRLPERPVVSVSGVTYRSTMSGDPAVALEADEFFLEGDLLIRYQGASWRNFEELLGDGWFGPEYELAVTYTHGWNPVPQLAKQIALEAVVRVWVNPGAVVSAGSGPIQTQFGQNPRGLLLTEHEEEQIRQTFGPKTYTGSVDLG